MCEGVGCFTSSRIDFQSAVVIVVRLRTVLFYEAVEPVEALSASAVEDDSVTDYQAFRVELKDKIAHVAINRPDKVNAMNAAFWSEIVDIFQWIDDTDDIRVVVLSGEGKHFSAGIDLQLLAQAASQMGSDVGRNAERLRRHILKLQSSFNAVDSCRKPVIAAIQGYCIGGAIDLIAACDMRYSTLDAQFSIKEIDMGMAADVGTLQRLPRIIGDGMMRELAYTGRTVDGQEAKSIGLVNRTYPDQPSLMAGVFAMAADIASKSPVAIRGTKEMIRYMRDHRVDDGLEYIATWNAAMLQSADLKVAMAAHMSKQKPDFAD
jgi:enoyl-CoA hydratase